MTRLFSLVATLATILAATEATAQYFHTPHWYTPSHHGHGQLLHHDYLHRPIHTPDVFQLDAYSDQLAKVARHLHEDAHDLSQDYEHSRSIEYFVDRVDRLQQHMHEILHEAAESGYHSTGLVNHVKNDVRQVSALFTRLYGEIEHQGIDGARTHDYQTMQHMRSIMIQEAFPLIRQLEIELYGYALNHRYTSSRFATPTHDLHRSRIRITH